MKVKFQPSGVVIEGDSNKSLLQLCQENGIHINSLCKGQPKCAECRVRIVSGEYVVVPPTQTELGLIGTNFYLDGRRLACQVRAFGDIEVDISEQVERDQSAHKKVRGFRLPSKGSPQESHAVLDTLVLNESRPEKK